MNIPNNCKDCIYLKIYTFNKTNIKEPKCMLTHPLSLANGCPNKRKDSFYKEL